MRQEEIIKDIVTDYNEADPFDSSYDLTFLLDKLKEHSVGREKSTSDELRDTQHVIEFRILFISQS